MVCALWHVVALLAETFCALQANALPTGAFVMQIAALLADACHNLQANAMFTRAFLLHTVALRPPYVLKHFAGKRIIYRGFHIAKCCQASWCRLRFVGKCSGSRLSKYVLAALLPGACHSLQVPDACTLCRQMHLPGERNMHHDRSFHTA